MIDSQYIAQHCQCARLRSASRLITRLYDDKLRPAGINSGQFTILIAIELMAQVSITALSDALAIERTTLTRNLAPLQKDGLIDIAAGKGRTRQVLLTTAGRKKLTQAKPLWEAAQTIIEQHLGEQQVTQLSGTLKNLKAALS